MDLGLFWISMTIGGLVFLVGYAIGRLHAHLKAEKSADAKRKTCPAEAAISAERQTPPVSHRVIDVDLGRSAIQVPMLEVRIGSVDRHSGIVLVGYTKDIAVAHEVMNHREYAALDRKMQARLVWQLADGTIVSNRPVYELRHLDAGVPK